MNQQERISFNAVVVAAICTSAVIVAVVAALAVDALPLLVIGAGLIGLIIIGLARVGVGLFSRYTEAALKRDALRFGHIETVMRMGYLPEGRNVRYSPIAPQLDTPSDIPVSVMGETASTVAAYSEDAINLLALSLQWQREASADVMQVIPYHLARKHDYFRDVAVWIRATQFLLVNQIAVERLRGQRKLGTFVITGTVEQAYQRMRASRDAPLPR
jgi:hypothetical protein